MTAKNNITIETFNRVAPHLPANIAVLMRGPTGVGKSFLAKQVAEFHDLPFIDVRGSTMSEGDVGGYPDIEGMKESGVMTFCMPSWFIRACNEPVVLMLDELNRSLPGVQQSFFSWFSIVSLVTTRTVCHTACTPTHAFLQLLTLAQNTMSTKWILRFYVASGLPTSNLPSPTSLHGLVTTTSTMFSSTSSKTILRTFV